MSEKPPANPKMSAEERVKTISEHYNNRQKALETGEGLEGLATDDKRRQDMWGRKYPTLNSEYGVDPDSDFNTLSELGGAMLREDEAQVIDGVKGRAGERNMAAARKHATTFNDEYRIVAAADALENGVLVNTPEVRELAANKIGARLHDNWRISWLYQDNQSEDPKGEYEQPTVDQAWIEANGKNVVDIANTRFEDLPTDWQLVKKTEAQAVVSLLLAEEDVMTLNIDDPHTRQRLGKAMHDAWLASNAESSQTGLNKPFAELSEDQQNSIVKKAQIAQKILNQLSINK